MERLVTPSRRGTSPTWGSPPSCEQALSNRSVSNDCIVGNIIKDVSIVANLSIVRRVSRVRCNISIV